MRDTGAYEDFVRGASTRLTRTAYLLLGDRAAAEDLVQEVLERMFVAWPRIEEPLAYAHRALAHRAQNRWRTRKARPEESWGDRELEAHDPDLADRDALLRALALLPRGQRAVIVLRYFDDLTIEQTAVALACTAGTVKSQTARALPRLRQLLSTALTEETC